MINVNMTPNPYDIQTLHCSQGDTEARKFELKLHNNGEVLDTSNVKEPIVYPVFKGSTEEILPVNESVPVTSPLKAQIQYPDGVRDVEFTYQQTPSSEDGQAKIKSIKGNTIKWNQLVQNGNFANTSNWTVSNGTYNVSANKLSLTPSTSTGAVFQNISTDAKQGHKYFVHMDVTSPVATTNTRIRLYNRDTSATDNLINFPLEANKRTSCDGFLTATANYQLRVYLYADYGYASTQTYIFENIMLIDLTQMFGSGNEPSTVEEFISLFPLPYYPYNQGELISFNGTGIKTVGFNQWDEEWENGSINSQGQNSQGTSTIRCKNYIEVFPNTMYYIRTGESASIGAFIYFYDADKNYLGFDAGVNTVFTTPSDSRYMRFRMYDPQYGTAYKGDICINISSDRNGTYEPYTSSTTSLPISTCFPTGMKSAGNVYDELLPTKATTRIGAVDLGTLDWAYQSGNDRFSANGALSSLAKLPSTNNDIANLLCAKYLTTSSNNTATASYDKSIGVSTLGNIQIRDTSYTSASDFKTAMSGVYLFYELATPTETSITTASLVSEYGEIPLKAEDDHLVAECTSELSSEAGFHDLKVKLSDEDGDVYSNKIQLHVERRP